MQLEGIKADRLLLSSGGGPATAFPSFLFSFTWPGSSGLKPVEPVPVTSVDSERCRPDFDDLEPVKPVPVTSVPSSGWRPDFSDLEPKKPAPVEPV